MNSEHYRKLENMYHNAPINSWHEPVLEVGDGIAEVSFGMKKEFFHAAGTMHGSLYFKGLDDAAFFAVSSVNLECFVVTSSFNIYLTRPVSEGRVISTGKVTHQSKRLYLAEAEMRTEDGKLVAQGSGAFMPTNLKLTADMGYC